MSEFEGRWTTRLPDGELGTHVCKHVWDGVRTGVSERLSSAHPVATSTRCVWTQVYAGVVAICSDQPVCDRCVVFGFVTRWKRGLCDHDQPYICVVSDDGGLLPCLFRGAWGMKESAVSDSGRGHWFIFWVGGIGNGKRRRCGAWSSTINHTTTSVR